MASILTITLNPALDLATSTAHVTPGPKLRCALPQVDPGGGGINVSRAIAAMGGDTRAMVALGGHTGDRIIGLLHNEGIAAIPFNAPGESRQSFAVTDDSTGAQFRFVTPGPAWPEGMAHEALSQIAQAATKARHVVLSGSLPPGVAADFPAQLCAALADTQARVVIDISGAPLNLLAASPSTPKPYLLRMDSVEAQELAGHPLANRVESARFATDLVARGVAEVVIVALGADGSVLASAQGCTHAAAADVPVRSKIGAGDSFVAGCVLAMAQGAPLTGALQHGAAAASAAVMTDATQLCCHDDVMRLLNETPLTDLTL